MRAWVLVAVTLVASGCRPSEEDCGKLLDHFLDVEGAAATEGKFREMPDALKAALAAKKKEFRDSLGKDFVGKCHAELSRAEVSCALRASDQAAMDRCEGR